MKTISLESTPVAKTSSFKSLLAVFFQWLGASVGFIASMIIADMLSPLPAFIMQEIPESGFMPQGAAMLFTGAVIAAVLLWAARRSSLKRFALFGQLFVLLFGAQTFQTQIETGYFISAFPLVHGNFELYHIILRGAISSALFVLLLVWMTGGFSRKERASTNFTVVADKTVKAGAWLAGIYFIIYLLFGYYVAWQSQELRLFYGGPAELNSFSNQILTTLMSKPEMPFFQYARGFVWILCLIPLFKGFSGGRVELVALSAFALALLPTAQLSFANPLMPAEISLSHFWETSISTGIFGALCAWFVPTQIGGR